MGHLGWRYLRAWSRRRALGDPSRFDLSQQMPRELPEFPESGIRCHANVGVSPGNYMEVWEMPGVSILELECFCRRLCEGVEQQGCQHTMQKQTDGVQYVSIRSPRHIGGAKLTFGCIKTPSWSSMHDWRRPRIFFSGSASRGECGGANACVHQHFHRQCRLKSTPGLSAELEKRYDAAELSAPV